MSTNRISSAAAVACLLLGTLFLLRAANRIVNNDEKPLMAIQLTNSTATPTAGIFIPPKGAMVFGDDGWPVSGAGYIEALEGRTYDVPFVWEGKNGETKFGGLRAERIDWDASGQLLSIRGLKAVFESEPALTVSSDAAKPKITNGILFLKFKEKGGVEFQFKISFGKGVIFSLPKGF